MTSPLVMYIVVNNDLNMGKGKIAAQVGHLVQDIIEDIMIKKYESKRTPTVCLNYDLWKREGCTKIVVKANKEQIKELMYLDNAFHIKDAGKTQIPEGSITVVGFPPMREIGKIFKDFKLL